MRSAQLKDSFLENFVFFFTGVAKSRRLRESDDSFLSVINAGEFRVDWFVRASLGAERVFLRRRSMRKKKSAEARPVGRAFALVCVCVCVSICVSVSFGARFSSPGAKLSTG